MYLGIDFLISPEREPFVCEVNLGLPGGAEEYDRAHRVFRGRPSGVFADIEKTSKETYGRPFAGYLNSLPLLPALKAFKLWMDGQGERSLSSIRRFVWRISGFNTKSCGASSRCPRPPSLSLATQDRPTACWRGGDGSP